MEFLIYVFLIACVYYNKKGNPWFLYHHIGEAGVPTHWFEEHLKNIWFLNMRTMTNKEILEAMEKNGKLPKNSVALTFDDGYYDNYKNAFPLLKKYKMKATLYLNTAYIEDENSREFKYLSWKEIEEMSESGVFDIELHSHRHMPIFVNTSFDRVVTSDDLLDRDIQHLYQGKAEIGFPIFGKRGEFSSAGVIVPIEAAKKFKNYYENLSQESKNNIKAIQEFINNELHKDLIFETLDDAKARVLNDLNTNISLIDEHTGHRPNFFCWPWGHRSPEFIAILKGAGIKGFVTTRKGTNSLKLDLENIRRVELRVFSPLKFKLNLLICRNYLLGRIYQLLS
ncbi:polysaccharide deacetylase family protein [Cetobacterium somerae]|uniref:polysaccharide deacetylase family protein n=1 Tax=Cetobacterium sp. NK01 TaxID=2993530 RepID=UPI002116ED36|nr:polysaccharide deacetylase family protein [Cetobacterium sp. NK01]MCQ8212084.1 polysaccharide deacetylase family protein [Cetobacterium sp. NK01]